MSGFLSSGIVNATAIPDSGGTHQWNHDEGTGTTLTDTGTNGSLDGTITGASWQSGAGTNDVHLNYAVDDYTTLTGGASTLTHFTNNGTGTFFTWVAPDSATGDNAIFANTNTNTDIGLFYILSGGNHDIQIGDGVSGSGSTIVDVTFSYGGSDGQWYPVAWTMDGSTFRVYEGETMTELGTDSISNLTAGDWTRDPEFGNIPNSTNFPMDGDMDMTWIDDVARSQTELQQFVDDTKQFYP